jgi:hypothetical protein
MKGTKFWQCFIYQNLFYILFVWCYAQTPRFMYFSWTEIFLPLCTIILCHVTLSVYPAKTQSKNCGWLLTSAQVFNSTPCYSLQCLNFLQMGFRSPSCELQLNWLLLLDIGLCYCYIAHEVTVLERFIRNGRTYRQSNFQLCIINLANMLSSSEISL